MNDNYSDIINLAPPVFLYPRISLYDRAAQFAPFAALTGFGALINEASRLTDTKPELDEQTNHILNERIKFIEENIKSKPEIEVTFFTPDAKKSGGSFKKLRGNIRRIDKVAGELIFTDKRKILLDDVIFIDGEFFKNIARIQSIC